MDERVRTGGAKRPVGETRRLVLERVAAGEGVTAIARDLGVSRAAVYQHIDALREAGDLPEPGAA